MATAQALPPLLFCQACERTNQPICLLLRQQGIAPGPRSRPGASPRWRAEAGWRGAEERRRGPEAAWRQGQPPETSLQPPLVWAGVGAPPQVVALAKLSS